jgi:hypothetical protein
MVRFTIRDMLWLTVVVGLALCWWLDRRASQASHAITRTHGDKLKRALSDAKFNEEFQEATIQQLLRGEKPDSWLSMRNSIDWNLTTQPIP